MNDILNVQLSKEKPPIFWELKKHFDVDWDNVIIADNRTIYSKKDIAPQKIIHEIVHLKQQEKVGRDLWWQTYIANKSFRLAQEIEAYRKEYAFIQQIYKDRNQRFDELYALARDLSSPQYGSIISFSDAMKLIQL